jgi:hypothetical protein
MDKTSENIRGICPSATAVTLRKSFSLTHLHAEVWERGVICIAEDFLKG